MFASVGSLARTLASRSREGARLPAADRLRRPGSLIGPGAVVALVAAYAALWLIARPAGQLTGRYLGEMAGMLALLLLSLALILSSGLMRVLEPAFGGFDRVMVWHHGVAVGGVLLAIPHWILVARRCMSMRPCCRIGAGAPAAASHRPG